MMLRLKCSPGVAAAELARVQHKTFQGGLARYWKVDDRGRIDGRSACWLFCWAKTGMGSQAAADDARWVFEAIIDYPFGRFDALVSHEWARAARYSPRPVDATLDALLGA